MLRYIYAWCSAQFVCLSQYLLRGDGFVRVSLYYQVPKGDGHTETVWIRPLKLGNIPIKVKAQSGQAADALVRRILVEVRQLP